jgi:hypothetical protein
MNLVRLPWCAWSATCFVAGCGYRPGQSFELPVEWLIVMLLVVPLLLAGLLGAFAFRRLTPFLFRCRRCGRAFRGAAQRGFPSACPHCGAPDWNLPV